MSERRNAPLGAGRRFATGCAAAAAGCVWAHALAGALRPLGADDAPLAAFALTTASILLGASIGLVLPSKVRPMGAIAIGGASGLAAAIGIGLAHPGALTSALALPVIFAVVSPAALWVAPRWPAALDELFALRRALALLWVFAALAGVVQIGRLATFMTDASWGFVLTTRHPFWHGHECLNAYLYGAELAERGVPDLYDPKYYPALNPQATPATSIEGMRVEDPYQYPPQFLLLPKAALTLSRNYDTLRVVWFGAQLTLFAVIYVLLASWVGGHARDVAMAALPVILGGFPFLHNFQFGQFHLLAVALSVGGMLAFAMKRRLVGGLLLASAILSKLFPGVLLIVLLARRRFRELAWTAAGGSAITAAALLLIGPAPFAAFVNEHLPRLSDGSAFAIDESWPELAGFIIADNQGIFGLARKFGFDKSVAATASRAFMLAVFGLALFVGLRTVNAARWAQAASWLALVGLASMASPGAWGDYTPVTALWLVGLIAAAARDSRRLAAALGIVAVFQYFLLGTMPLGEWAPIRVMVPVATFGLLSLLGLYLGVAIGAERLGGARAADERGELPSAA